MKSLRSLSLNCLVLLITTGSRRKRRPPAIKGEPLPVASPESFGIANFILSIFPDNIFYSLANFELLPVVIFSIMFGLGCSLTGLAAKPIIQFAIAVREASGKCLHGVMLIAPLGIFSLVGAGVAQSYLSGDLKENFSALLAFVFVLMVGLFLQGLWQLLAVAFATKQKISHILLQSLPVFSTAFSTSSSVGHPAYRNAYSRSAYVKT